MTDTSPRPWRIGTSEASEGLTVYSHNDGAPRGKIIGFMRDTDDTKHLVKAVNAYDSLSEPSSIEEDLRKGFDESERRRRIALLVLSHHQEHLAFIGPEVINGFDAVRAVLNGKTDPKLLGIEGSPVIVDQVRVILASQDGVRDV